MADSSALAAEVINAVSAVQSDTAEPREATRFAQATQAAFDTAVRRTRAHGRCWWLSSSLPTRRCCCGVCTRAHRRCGWPDQRRAPGQTALYVTLLAGAVAVLGEVYGDLLRAPPGATEPLMELLDSASPVASPAQPRAHCLTRAGAWPCA